MEKCKYNETIQCQAKKQPSPEPCFVCLAFTLVHNVNHITEHLGEDILVPLRDATFLYNASKNYGKAKIALQAWFKNNRPKEKIELENLDISKKMGYVQ